MTEGPSKVLAVAVLGEGTDDRAGEADAPPRTDSPPGAANRFTRALYNESAVTFVGAVLFALLEATFFVLFATPRHLANVSPWLAMRYPRDDYARDTMITHRLHRYGASGALSVVYVGSSVAQRALFDSWDPKPIEQALAIDVGEHVDFYSLYASSETVHEAELMARYVPEGFRGVVTVVIYDDKDDERSFESALAQAPSLEERLALDPLEHGAKRVSLSGKTLSQTGIYFVDHLQFFSARRDFLLHPWVVWAPYPRGGYHLRAPPAPGAEEKQLVLRRERPHPLLGRSRDVLGKLVDETKAKGAIVVLVEAPLNPRYQELKGAMRGEDDTAIRAFANEHGVEYWNFNPELHFARRDFEDAVHLGVPAKRLKYQQTYCEHVAEKLRLLRGKTGVAGQGPGDGDEAPANDPWRARRSRTPTTRPR